MTVQIIPTVIRCNSKLKGTIHNKVEKKICQFSDDTVLSVVVEDKSLSLTCIDHFIHISGLGMNKNKSTIIRIGSITYSYFILLCGRELNGSDWKF